MLLSTFAHCCYNFTAVRRQGRSRLLCACVLQRLELESYSFKKAKKKPALTLVWAASSQHPQSVTQTITLFTSVICRLISANEPMKWIVCTVTFIHLLILSCFISESCYYMFCTKCLEKRIQNSWVHSGGQFSWHSIWFNSIPKNFDLIWFDSLTLVSWGKGTKGAVEAVAHHKISAV